jgi:hypothetical protein
VNLAGLNRSAVSSAIELARINGFSKIGDRHPSVIVLGQYNLQRLVQRQPLRFSECLRFRWRLTECRFRTSDQSLKLVEKGRTLAET